jgi:hypothetical protein
MQELIDIQRNLNCPKNQYNAFGKYKYRSCEDILEGLKPQLHEYGCYVTLTDEVTELGGVLMIKATATITNSESKSVSVSAFAGIDPNKKGMDISQTFGSSSSYARKYALNGLFAIDDTKDADTQDNRSKDVKPANKPATTTPKKQTLKPNSPAYNTLYEKYRDAKSNDERNQHKQKLIDYYTNAEEIITKFDETYAEYVKAKNK